MWLFSFLVVFEGSFINNYLLGSQSNLILKPDLNFIFTPQLTDKNE